MSSSVDGRTWSYTYDAAGRVLEALDPSGKLTSYQYDGYGNETEIASGGEVIQRRFNGQGLVTEERLNGLLKHSYRYNTDGQVTEETNGLGQVTRYEYETSLTSVVEGNLTRVLHPDGSEQKYSWYFKSYGLPGSVTDAEGHTTTFSKGLSGNLSSMTDPLGVKRFWGYDANGNRTSEQVTRTVDGVPVVEVTLHRYDGKNREIETQYPDGTKVTKDYDANGMMTKMVGRGGSELSMTLDKRGNPAQISLATGQRLSEEYDRSGNKSKETDSYGRETRYEYDYDGRLVKTWLPDGRYTHVQYDAQGREARVRDADGRWSEYEYDLSGNRIRETDSAGRVVQHEYDLADREIRTIDPLGRVTQYDYDVAGNVVRTEFADGSEVRMAYDKNGRKVKEWDELGNLTAYDYDAVGRLVAVTDAQGQSTHYRYDEIGNRIEQVEANGAVTRWRYDSNGRVLSRQLPDGSQEQFRYGTEGQKLSQIDVTGAETRYEYNGQGELVKEVFADGTRREYSQAADGSSARQIDPNGRVIDYRYEFERIVEVKADGHATRYDYDSLGRLSRVTAADGEESQYQYDAVDRVTQLSRSNGVTSRYQYDLRDRLLSLEHRDASGGVLLALVYRYDAVGNRVQVTENGVDVTQYQYDGLNRLVSEQVKQAGVVVDERQYVWDAVSNAVATIDNGVTTDYQYDAGGRLVQKGSEQLRYTPKGQLFEWHSSHGKREYQWDARGRLSQVTAPGLRLNYGYDAADRRIERVRNGQRQQYLLDGVYASWPHVLAEYGSGGLSAWHDYGLSRLSRAGQTVLADALGSTRALVDAGGAVSARYRYNGQGQLQASSGSQADQPFRYAGEFWEDGAEAYHLRARDYLPELGRFNQRDSWQGDRKRPITLNAYLYGDANPVMNTDPSGHMSLSSLSAGMNMFNMFVAQGSRMIAQGTVRCAKMAAHFSSGIGAALIGSKKLFLKQIKGAGYCGITMWQAGFFTANHFGIMLDEGVALRMPNSNSFDNLKEDINKALMGRDSNPKYIDWHHVVERQQYEKMGKFRAKSVHSIGNLVPTLRPIHSGIITPYYSRIHHYTNGLTLRHWLAKGRASVHGGKASSGNWDYDWQWRAGVQIWERAHYSTLINWNPGEVDF